MTAMQLFLQLKKIVSSGSENIEVKVKVGDEFITISGIYFLESGLDTYQESSITLTTY